jgi:hypothetical protein
MEAHLLFLTDDATFSRGGTPSRGLSRGQLLIDLNAVQGTDCPNAWNGMASARLDRPPFRVCPVPMRRKWCSATRFRATFRCQAERSSLVRVSSRTPTFAQGARRACITFTEFFSAASARQHLRAQHADESDYVLWQGAGARRRPVSLFTRAHPLRPGARSRRCTARASLRCRSRCRRAGRPQAVHDLQLLARSGARANASAPAGSRFRACHSVALNVAERASAVRIHGFARDQLVSASASARAGWAAAAVVSLELARARPPCAAAGRPAH